MITTRTNELTGETRFVWTRKGHDDVVLRRVCGGLGWPSKGAPGFMCVIGEEAAARPEFPKEHSLHVLAEFDDWQGVDFLSVAHLFDAALAVQRLCRVEEWWADERPEFASDLRQCNRHQVAQRKAVLRIRHHGDAVTPEWAAMRVYRRSAGQKTLFFHHADKVRAAMSGLDRDLSAMTWTDNPPLSALFQAVAALEFREYRGPVRAAGYRPADGVAGY